jgi:hypothetical protein
MLFPATELKEYAEPINPRQLVKNEIYFSLQYLDSRLEIPVLQPLIFLGEMTERSDERLCFQNYGSYLAGIRLETAMDQDLMSFQMQTTNNVNHIFEFEKALELLMLSGLKRKQSRSQRPEPPTTK